MGLANTHVAYISRMNGSMYVDSEFVCLDLPVAFIEMPGSGLVLESMAGSQIEAE